MPDHNESSRKAPTGLSPEDARRDTVRIAAELAGPSGTTDPFAAAARATRMPMIITDPRLPDNPIVFVNDSFCRLSGYARTDILNRNCRFLQCPETDPEAVARIRAAIHAEQPIEIDIRNRRKDGQLFWNRLLVAPVRDADGALAYFFASQVDVTLERERLAGLESQNAALLAEVADRLHAQEESEARLRFATEAGRLGVWELDLRTGVLTASATFRAAFGRDAAEPFTYEDLEATVHPDDRRRRREAIELSLATGADYDIEFRVVRPDDSQGWVDVRAQVARGPDGRPARIAGIALDSTERHQAELDRTLREESLRLSNDAGEIGTWDLDLTTDVLTWPDRTKAMFGISPAAPSTMDDFYAGLHPEDLDRVAGQFAAAIDPARRATYDVEYRTVGKEDGLVRWVAARGRGLFDEAGRCVRAIGTAIDITARKLAEERQLALLRLGDRLRALSDPAEMSFAAAETLGTTLRVSRAGYGTFDAVAETVTIERDWTMPGVPSLAGMLRFRDYGSYIEDLKRGETVAFDDAEKDARTAAAAQALKSINAQSAVNMPVTEQGGLVALLYLNHATARAWSPEDLAFVREVAERTRAATERRRAEQALGELAATLEARVEERTAERDRVWRNSRDLLAVIGADGVCRAANPAWTAVLGYRPEEVAGRSFLDFAWSDEAELDPLRPDRPSAPRSVTDCENRYRHKDGTPRWISWRTSVEGDLVYAYGRHVTAEKEARLALENAEEALRQSQKMEAVGQLTGGIAHDFNNLLTGIAGSLELMQARVAQGRINDVDRYLSAAQGAAKRAAALTHRLLAFSRRQTLDPKPTDVNRLAAGMEELIRRTMGPEIAVEVVAGGGVWTTLVDPSQLENALLNLCINARDAMPEGGKLSIETANRWLDERAARERELPPGQYVSLSVSDNGTGMSPDVAARAFDPFFTTKPIGQGTGLGLSMIYGFVRQSGGQVRIYSETGRGTLVCLYLPRHLGAVESAGPPPGPAEAPRAEQGETVLVVDDEPTIRMLVAEVLDGLGYIALEAADGAAGLKILQSDARIDLLVTDVGLPGGMNGRQLADAARTRRRDLKVLFITGYAENAVLSHGHLDPSMQMMTKPFEMDALAKRVRSLIEESGRR